MSFFFFLISLLAPCPSWFFSWTITRIPKFTFHFVLKPVLCTNTSNHFFLHQAPLLKFNIEFYLLYLLNALSSYLTSSDFVCEKIWLSLIFFFYQRPFNDIILVSKLRLKVFSPIINKWTVNCKMFLLHQTNKQSLEIFHS